MLSVVERLVKSLVDGKERSSVERSGLGEEAGIKRAAGAFASPSRLQFLFCQEALALI